MTPRDKVSPEDADTYRSTIFHELVHAKQEFELYQYFFNKDTARLPEWKMKFYLANSKDGSRIHIGAELDAHYQQALFEKQELGKVSPPTLAGFFELYGNDNE